MIYVQRDQSGAVCGIYANPQPQPDGSCLTDKNPLAEDSPEVLQFFSDLALLKPSLGDGALVDLLVKKAVISQAEVDAAIAPKNAR